MKEARFHTKSGKLTPFAFRCGYVERKGSLSLHMEHNVYHVRGFIGDRHIVGSFDTLTEARRFMSNPDAHVVSRTGSITCR